VWRGGYVECGVKGRRGRALSRVSGGGEQWFKVNDSSTIRIWAKLRHVVVLHLGPVPPPQMPECLAILHLAFPDFMYDT
jgi:hypothetical protein